MTTPTLPACPVCGTSDTVLPARSMPRPEAYNARAVACVACGDAVPATRQQVAAINRRERIREEALARKARDEGRGVHVALAQYVATVEAEEAQRRQRKPKGAQGVLPGVV